MTKVLAAIPGSDAFLKLINALKNFTRTDDTNVACTDTVTVGELEFTASLLRKPVKVKKVALTAADTAGGVFAFSPGVACIVQRVLLNRTTAATSACTVDIGVATNATTSADNLLDGLDVNAAAGVSDNIEDKGSNGKSRQRMTSTQYVTGSVASGASAGLVGFAYIEYVEI